VLLNEPRNEEIIKGSDNSIYHSELLVFGLCPLSGILKTGKHIILETGSVSIHR
jgi:hypothetical protein